MKKNRGLLFTIALIFGIMPIIENSEYIRRPWYMLNAHWETIIPSMFFKVKQNPFQTQRKELEDGDFIDIDWISTGKKRCLIVSHGLEGGSDRYYVKRTSLYFKDRGWDIAAWNCRSCSGEMNRLPRFYHHGDTPDLDIVVQEVLKKEYTEIVLMGYSMGGSLCLKYLGEALRTEKIKGAIVYSVPCNLRDSAIQLTKKENRIYEQRFLKKLTTKIRLKSEIHSEIDAEGLNDLTDFDSFHDRFTAPLHGFADKEEFFDMATCDRYFEGIDVPVLIVNAANDPMLGEKCYPIDVASQSEFIYLEIPELGGHAGFSIHGKPHSYMEERTAWFIDRFL